MRFLVFGNINAGKTTVSQKLKEIFPDYPYLAIDNFRIEYGKGDYDSDILAMDKFVESVSSISEGIIECTGLGPLGKKLSNVISGKSDLIFHVKSPLNLCLERIKTKRFSDIPYPPFEETLENTIIRCHYEFERGDLESLWFEKVLDIVDIDGAMDIADQLQGIPFPLYRYLGEIVRLLEDNLEIKSLIASGSFSRGELTANSDLDLYAITDLLVQSVMEILKEGLDYPVWYDRIDNKITIWYQNNDLVEIVCVPTIEEIKVYFRESQTKDVRRSILKVNEDLIPILESYSSFPENHFQKLVDELLSEIVYYFLSLEKLIIKKDRYKYYFHNNIILHNYVRLKALEKGIREYNYLPLQADQYLSDRERDVLIMNYEDVQSKHRDKLGRLLIEFTEHTELFPNDEKLIRLKASFLTKQ